MDHAWEVRAVWLDRGGTSTERRYHFGQYADARREVVRLFCHLGTVERDEKVLVGLEINGDYWACSELCGETRSDSLTVHRKTTKKA